MVKRLREEEEEEQEPSKRRKKSRKTRIQTPLGKFRAQTIARKKELSRIIRQSNSELRAIIRDLGRLKRNGKKI